MIGYLGSALLAYCGVPELIRTFREKKCHLGWGFLLMWFFGEVFVLYHVLTTVKDSALLLNYISNCVILTLMLYYKVRYK